MIGIVALAFGSPPASADPEPMYVQAAKVELRKEPRMDAARVVELPRGSELLVLEKQTVWYRASAGGKEGWVSRLFLSAHKPVGSADLAKDVNVSLEKASRRRSSSYSVSASTRGLTAEDRVREGRESYQSDFDALAKIEEYQVKKEDLDNFRRSAKLSGE